MKKRGKPVTQAVLREPCCIIHPHDDLVVWSDHGQLLAEGDTRIDITWKVIMTWIGF